MSQPQQPASATPATENKTSKLQELFAHPLRLRAVVSLAMVASWYVLAYMPMAGQIEAITAQLKVDRERVAIAKQVDVLRKESDEIKNRIPPKANQSEWLQFLMGIVRANPVKLISLNPVASREVGPYKLLAFRIVIEGQYPDICKFLKEIESNRRLVRVESIRIAEKAVDPSARETAKSDAPVTEMSLTVLGILY